MYKLYKSNGEYGKTTDTFFKKQSSEMNDY